MGEVGYTTVGSNSLEKAKAFYDELLGSIGMHALFEHPSGGRVYGNEGQAFFGVLGPFDGQLATAGNGAMVAFKFDSTDEIDAFHSKALQLGAGNEGDPGERSPGMYFCYLRDLDGNKLAGYKMSFG